MFDKLFEEVPTTNPNAMEFRIPSKDAIQQCFTPKMRSTAEAVIGIAYPNHQYAASHDRNIDWNPATDPNILKEFTSLSRLRTPPFKLERVQSAHAAAKDQMSLPRLTTYLKKVEDAHTEFYAVHSKVITIVPDPALQRQEEVFADFEDRYNVVRTMIEDLITAQGKSPVRCPNPQLQTFNDPIPTVDWSNLYFLEPVVEKPKKKDCEKPQDNHELPNHASTRSHPKHFQITAEDLN